jgi:branched-subunit amino acid ABC-type transport system permease component
MPNWVIIAITLVVMLGVTGYLIGSLVLHVLQERRSNNVRRLWRNFGLSFVFCGLFLLSWGTQAITEWGEFRAAQQAHGEPAEAGAFIMQFGQSTFENWQSEFLQLFSFVVLSALLIHRGSAESKDSDERLEEKIDDIVRRLDEIGSARS